MPSSVMKRVDEARVIKIAEAAGAAGQQVGVLLLKSFCLLLCSWVCSLFNKARTIN